MLLVDRVQQRRNQTGPIVALFLSNGVTDMRTVTEALDYKIEESRPTA